MQGEPIDEARMPELSGRMALPHPLGAGAGTVVAGVVLVAVGVAGALTLLGRLPSVPAMPTHVRLVVAGATIATLVFGMLALRTGLSGLLWRAKAGDRAARAPWQWDHPWDHGAAADILSTGIVSGWVAILAFGCCLAPIVGLAVALRVGRGIPWFVLVVMGFFVLVYALILGAHAWRTVVRLTHGPKRLRLTRFPYFTGEEIIVALERGESLRGAKGLTATLRCVREAVEPRGKSARVVARELWSETVEVEGPRLSACGNEVSLLFQPPAAAPATSLAGRPKIYWEVEMRADVAGPDWRAQFLVPVYRRAGDEAPEDSSGSAPRR